MPNACCTQHIMAVLWQGPLVDYMLWEILLWCRTIPELTFPPRIYMKTAIHESVSGKVQPHIHTGCTYIIHNKNCLLFILLCLKVTVSMVDCILWKHKAPQSFSPKKLCWSFNLFTATEEHQTLRFVFIWGLYWFLSLFFLVDTLTTGSTFKILNAA